jgi:hypothetical protein
MVASSRGVPSTNPSPMVEGVGAVAAGLDPHRLRPCQPVSDHPGHEPIDALRNRSMSSSWRGQVHGGARPR